MTWAPQPRKPNTVMNLCKIHNEYGHDTDECSHLRDKSERMIKDNHLKKFVARQKENGA